MADQKFYTKFEKTKKITKASKDEKEKNVSRQKFPDEKKQNSAQKKDFSKNSNQRDVQKGTQQIKAETVHSLFAADNISKEALDIINNFDEIIQGVRPLNSKQLQQLPENIRTLSHQLTDERSTRRLGYMNESIQLSSYVRYYTWWNLVRLVKLFSNLPAELFPKDNDICLDLGSGPLTVVTALWLARKELRNKKLTWYCLDVSSSSMALGEDIFLSVAAKTNCEPWKIIRVKGAFGTAIKQKCNFITCANMLNELDQASDMPPEFQSKKYFDQIMNYAAQDAGFLLIEPGVPKAARTLALLRQRFISAQKSVLAPCPHSLDCPMNGFKAYTGSHNKWCNFSFSTEDAPLKLQKLSTLAKLPKERATLSFICASSKPVETKQKENNIFVRINSDPFRLPQNKTGFYGCSSLGLTLVSTKSPESITSGNLLKVQINDFSSLKTDEKSGAKIIEV